MTKRKSTNNDLLTTAQIQNFQFYFQITQKTKH